MRIAVDSAQLSRALAFSVARENQILDVLKQVRLRAANEAVLIDSTDLTIYTTTAVPARIDDPGEGLFNAALLSAAATGDGEIVVSDKAVTRGRSRLRVPYSDKVADFPMPDALEFEPMKVDPVVFAAALDATMFAAPRDDARRWLNGVHVITGCVSASPSYLVATVDLDYTGPSFILPTAIAQRVRKLLGEGATIELGGVRQGRASMIRVRAGHDTLTAALIDGKAQSLRDPFPRTWPEPDAVADSATLVAGLQRIVHFLPILKGSTFAPLVVQFDPNNGECRLEDKERTSVETIPLAACTTAQQFGIDARFLSLVVQNVKAERVEIAQVEPGNKIGLPLTLVRAAGGSDTGPRYAIAGVNL